MAKITCVISPPYKYVMLRLMTDPLLSRAQLAMDESYALRERLRKIMAQFEEASSALQMTIFESAMMRTEIKAHRDNRG